MSDLIQQLNKIAADKQTNGKETTLLATAALVLLDKHNEVQFDGDDLSGTFDRLIAKASSGDLDSAFNRLVNGATSGDLAAAFTKLIGAATLTGDKFPVTKKVSFTDAQIVALGAVASGDLPALLLPARAVVLSTTVKHSASLIGPAAAATDTLTSDNLANVADGETVTIGTKVYTFRTILTPLEGEVLIGADADGSLLNLIHAINHTGTPGTDYDCAAVHPTVSAAAAVTAHAFAVTAKTAGLAGNAIGATTTAIHLAWGTATLAGGLDDTLTVATAEIVSAQHNYGTAFDVFQAAGAEVYDFDGTAKSELMAGPAQLNLHIALTGANCADISVGAVDAWITYFIRP